MAVMYASRDPMLSSVADVDAGGGQRLAVDLGEQGALREVGRADDDRTTPTGRAGNTAGLGGTTARRRGGPGASGLGADGGDGFRARSRYGFGRHADGLGAG